MALQPGTKLGPYSVTAKIGEGGMGEVYRARDTTLDGTWRSRCCRPEAVSVYKGADPACKMEIPVNRNARAE